jgi:hypothetical protein
MIWVKAAMLFVAEGKDFIYSIVSPHLVIILVLVRVKLQGCVPSWCTAGHLLPATACFSWTLLDAEATGRALCAPSVAPTAVWLGKAQAMSLLTDRLRAPLAFPSKASSALRTWGRHGSLVGANAEYCVGRVYGTQMLSRRYAVFEHVRARAT